MAHTCPKCQQYCTCNGDWDDIDLGDDFNCICCEGREEEDSNDDDYDYDDEGLTTTPPKSILPPSINK